MSPNVRVRQYRRRPEWGGYKFLPLSKAKRQNTISGSFKGMHIVHRDVPTRLSIFPSFRQSADDGTTTFGKLSTNAW